MVLFANILKKEIYEREPAAVILCLGHVSSITNTEDLEGAVSCLFLVMSGLLSPMGVGSWGADVPGHGDEVWWSAEV